MPYYLSDIEILLMINSLLYSVYDTLALLFSLVVSMTIGTPFQPQPIVFLIVFLSSRALIYWLWFEKIKEQTIPWLRLAIHTLCLLLILPILIAAAGFLLSHLANNLFWFGVVPAVSIIISFAVHYLYKLSEV